MMSEKIQIALIKRKMSRKDLAEVLGCSPQNVYALLKKDNLNEDQLKKIAEKLNCDLNMELVMKDTGERL